MAHQQDTTLARRACCIETRDRLAIASSDLKALGHGKPGMGGNRAGAEGGDLRLPVPDGTVVKGLGDGILAILDGGQG